MERVVYIMIPFHGMKFNLISNRLELPWKETIDDLLIQCVSSSLSWSFFVCGYSYSYSYSYSYHSEYHSSHSYSNYSNDSNWNCNERQRRSRYENKVAIDPRNPERYDVCEDEVYHGNGVLIILDEVSPRTICKWRILFL